MIVDPVIPVRGRNDKTTPEIITARADLVHRWGQGGSFTVRSTGTPAASLSEVGGRQLDHVPPQCRWNLPRSRELLHLERRDIIQSPSLPNGTTPNAIQKFTLTVPPVGESQRPYFLQGMSGRSTHRPEGEWRIRRTPGHWLWESKPLPRPEAVIGRRCFGYTHKEGAPTRLLSGL